eukprot:2672673-Pyramimonas_sp.AAC.1
MSNSTNLFGCIVIIFTAHRQHGSHGKLYFVEDVLRYIACLLPTAKILRAWSRWIQANTAFADIIPASL